MSERIAAETPVGEGTEAAPPKRRPSRLAQELGIVGALWRRDLSRLSKERSRWLGVVLQPVLFWAILGSGMAHSFEMPGAEGVDYLTYFFPGVLVMILLFTTIFATIGVIEDRRMGFLQSVLVAPGSRFSMVLGKVAGVTTLALFQASLFLVLLPLAGYHFGAVDWPALALVVLLSCVGLTAANLSVAWLIPSVQGYHAIMSVVMIPLWILSGAMFPPEGTWLEGLAAINPLSYMVWGARAAMHGEVIGQGAGLGTSLAVVAGFAAAALGLAARVTRRR